tara:strand:+ start:28488 stop:29678 length:1191 start_codon:yes stop_codon:yes gene_type:complete
MNYEEELNNIILKSYREAFETKEKARKLNDGNLFNRAAGLYLRQSEYCKEMLESGIKLSDDAKNHFLSDYHFMVYWYFQCLIGELHSKKIEDYEYELELSEKSKKHIQNSLKHYNVIASNNQNSKKKDEFIRSDKQAAIDVLQAKAKKSINNGDYIEAFDFNKEAIVVQQELVELCKKKKNYTDLRIQKGNLANKYFNQSQILYGTILKNTDGKFNFNLIKKLIDSYDFTISAMDENPEAIKEYKKTQNQILVKLEELLESENFKIKWAEILTHFDDKIIRTIMQKNDLDAFVKAKAKTELENNQTKILLIRGLFWIGMAGVLYFMLRDLASNNEIDLVRFFGVLFGFPVIFIIVGAFILKSTNALSQVNFIKLLRLTLNINLKGISALNPSKNDT